MEGSFLKFVSSPSLRMDKGKGKALPTEELDSNIPLSEEELETLERKRAQEEFDLAYAKKLALEEGYPEASVNSKETSNTKSDLEIAQELQQMFNEEAAQDKSNFTNFEDLNRFVKGESGFFRTPAQLLQEVEDQFKVKATTSSSKRKAEETDLTLESDHPSKKHKEG